MARAQKLDIIINAKDNSKKAFKSTEKSMKGLNKAAKGLALGIGGLFAFKTVTGFLKDATKAFGEQERAEKKLESIMTKVNDATTEQIDAMKAQARSLQKVTTVGDEVTIALQAQLGTFGLSAEAVMNLTESTLDLAVANKGVNVTQEDMINFGNLVGKVMTGNTGSLGKYGIVLTDAQREQLKFGDEMEKSAVLAEVLKGNYGDLARDMKDTWEGRVKSFKNSWGDLMEMIGEKLMPVLTDLVIWATDTGIPKLIEAGAWLKERWDGNFLGIQTILKTTLAAIQLSFNGWIAAIELMIAAWDRAVKAYEKFKGAVGSVGIRTVEDFQEANPAPDVSGIRASVPTEFNAQGGIAGANSRGTDTIPAMLTPGELILNKAQQETLAGQINGGGVTIEINNPNFRDEQNSENIIQDIVRALQQANLGVA